MSIFKEIENELLSEETELLSEGLIDTRFNTLESGLESIKKEFNAAKAQKDFKKMKSIYKKTNGLRTQFGKLKAAMKEGKVNAGAKGALKSGASELVFGDIDNAAVTNKIVRKFNPTYKKRQNAFEKKLVATQISMINDLKSQYPKLEKQIKGLKKRDAKFSEDMKLVQENVLFESSEDIYDKFISDVNTILESATVELFADEYYSPDSALYPHLQ